MNQESAVFLVIDVVYVAMCRPKDGLPLEVSMRAEAANVATLAADRFDGAWWMGETISYWLD